MEVEARLGVAPGGFRVDELEDLATVTIGIDDAALLLDGMAFTEVASADLPWIDMVRWTADFVDRRTAQPLERRRMAGAVCRFDLTRHDKCRLRVIGVDRGVGLPGEADHRGAVLQLLVWLDEVEDLERVRTVAAPAMQLLKLDEHRCQFGIGHR